MRRSPEEYRIREVRIVTIPDVLLLLLQNPYIRPVVTSLFFDPLLPACILCIGILAFAWEFTFGMVTLETYRYIRHCCGLYAVFGNSVIGRVFASPPLSSSFPPSSFSQSLPVPLPTPLNTTLPQRNHARPSCDSRLSPVTTRFQ